MKKSIIISIVFLHLLFITGCVQNQTSQAKSTTSTDSIAVDKKNSESKTIDSNGIIAYLSYNGTATDDGNITGKNTNDEFHLFMKNDTKNIVYVISKFNYGLWSSKKIMPSQLKPMTQTYKADIASLKKLKDNDNSVEYYEITKLNSLIETDETD